MSAAKILIVEDEGLTAMELQRKLKMAGYDVPTFAFSGKEAIKKAEEIKPDLVLMDIFLKGHIDGIDAAGEIKKKLNVPIIYLTAHGDPKTKERAKITEPFAYLLKPFDVEILRQNIDQALYEQKVGRFGNNQVLEKDTSNYDGGVFVTDNNGIIQFTNHQSHLITEIDQKQALGKNITEVFKIKQITDLDVEVSNKNLLNPVSYFKEKTKSTVSEKSEELSGMAWLETNSGYLKAIKYTLCPLKDKDNSFNGLSIFFNDINLLKELDITLDSIENVCDQFPQETAIFNENGDLIQANKLFLDFFKVDNLKELNLNLFDNLGFHKEAANNINDYHDFNYESLFNDSNINLNPNFSSKIKNGLYLKLNCNKIPSNSGNSGYLVHLTEIDKLSFNGKSTHENRIEMFNSTSKLNSPSKNTEVEKMALEIEKFKINEQNLMKEHDLVLENLNKTIKSLENDKVELVSRLEEYKNYSDELKGKLDLELKLNESLMDMKKEVDQADKYGKETSEKESILELKESLKKYERQYKTLFEENKSLRENKSKLKKQANKIKKEYLVMEKEFKDQLKSYKAQIDTLKNVNNSLRNDLPCSGKKAFSLKEESEKRIVQLENEKNQEIEKQNILKKQIKDIQN